MPATQYLLAVDVGTSRTAASTAHPSPNGGLVTRAFGLGRSTDSAPSAIFVSDGELLFGEAAERRGLAQPERLVREFKRRIGDDVPIVVDGRRFAPEELYARTVAWVVDAVAEREGHQPAAISVTTPVTWGEYRSRLAASALAREIASPVELITEPEAAARHYETTSPLEIGQAIAVYDLGGGTFDAVILRKEADGSVRLLGAPAGIADFGGVDFDDIVLRHVIAAAGLSASELTGDAAARVALATLRRECVEAKEALSFDSEAVVPVLVGQTQTTVRLTRSEFEGMIEEGVERTIDVLGGALDAAGMTPADLETILLTGGSSRIPRIAQLLSERFDLPISIDADPKAIVALGAARELADRRTAAAAATAIEGGTLTAAAAVPLAAAEAASPRPPRRVPEAKRKWFGFVPVSVAVAGGAVVLAGGIVVAGATMLGSGMRVEAEPRSELSTDWLGFSLVKSSTSEGAGGTNSTTQAAAAPQRPHSAAPSLKAPSPLADRPNGTAPSRSESAARPSRIPSAEAPRPQTQNPPTNPPADPTPTGPPVDPTPTDPPVDPTPTDPPVDPTPTDPPVDPTPTDPPVDPEPTTPPQPEPEPTP